ncbi:MAG: hypothetical protein CSA39_06465 [Flavobacteriales bacterium]|nr:MAG: hypothetical protein CR989_04130 [Flavobacteriales bacterium]PIE48701.1 MAG: hypothetical protein CSA39_06465 [Flavobacteriales bacterium]
MKKILLPIALFSIMLIEAQAFYGKEDKKLQVGVNLQHNATSLHVSYDYGLGENISLGIGTAYAIGLPEDLSADFSDRLDLKARFNANIGNVLNIDNNFGFYPGLSFSLKNFGGHVGARYFFTDGFGIYSEANFPLARYKPGDLTPSEKLHNQFTISFGTVFNFN